MAPRSQVATAAPLIPDAPTLDRLRAAAIHKKPNVAEITACKPWLEAAQAVIGKGFKVSRRRGELVESPLAPLVTATVHPSSILRERDDEARRKATQEFIRDLRNVATELKGA